MVGNDASVGIAYGLPPESDGAMKFALPGLELNDASPINCGFMAASALISPCVVRSFCMDYTLLSTVRPNRPDGFTTSTATMMTRATVSLSSVPTR